MGKREHRTDQVDIAARLRELPKVDVVLKQAALEPWKGAHLATEAVREALERVRETLRKGGPVPDAGAVADTAAGLLRDRFRPRLRRVVNGTGIVIHTNLGRAPLGQVALNAMVEAARGYSTLEFDLERGRRGSRHDLVKNLLCALTGAEDALVVNNNASAVLLALTALAKRKQVIVSRGQLVEIGGSFRIPDICKVSGSKLVEVGTTNRTRVSDYADAINERTGLLLRVHPSNFRVIGFTETVQLDEMVELAHGYKLPVVDDLGSGALVDLSMRTALPREPLVSESVAAGADVVTFSGDKLLGGPQAGLAVGRATAIAKMRKHPLMRAVRPDKLTFAALDAILRAYLTPSRLAEELPLWRMLEATVDDLEAWGRPLLKKVAPQVKKTPLSAEFAPSLACSGGGSLPEEEMPSLALRLEGPGRVLNSLQGALRLGDPPVIGYLKDGALWFDLRTMILDDPEEIASAILEAFKGLRL